MRIFRFKDGSQMRVDGGDGNHPMLLTRQYTAVNVPEVLQLAGLKHQEEVAETVKSVSLLLATAAASGLAFCLVDFPYLEGKEQYFLAAMVGIGLIGVAAGVLERMKHSQIANINKRLHTKNAYIDQFMQASSPYSANEINPN